MSVDLEAVRTHAIGAVVANGMTETDAGWLWDTAFGLGTVIGEGNALSAVANHGLDVGADLLLSMWDAERAASGPAQP